MGLVLPSKMYSVLNFPFQCFKNGLFQKANFLSAKSFIDPKPKILSKTLKVPSYPLQNFLEMGEPFKPILPKKQSSPDVKTNFVFSASEKLALRD